MRKFYDAAVVFGGISNENEVSVITGVMVCNVLKKGGKSVLPVYIGRKGVMRAGEELADIEVYKKGADGAGEECAFKNGGAVFFNSRGKAKRTVGIGCGINCCHGGIYEGGALAGVFGVCNLPFASARLFESAAFMDKYYTKLVLQSLGVNLAEYVFARSGTEAADGAEKLGYPVIVKPVTLGSSVGIARADDFSQLAEALEVAFGLDTGVLLEKYLSPRREINCAAYFADGKVNISPLEEVASSGDVLSYDDKYSGGGKRIFPAELNAETAEEIKTTTEKVYASLNMRGIVRFDYILYGGKVYLSEINTVPGSLSQYLVSSGYGEFYKILEKVMLQARKDFNERGKKKVIETGILNNIRANTCKLK